MSGSSLSLKCILGFLHRLLPFCVKYDTFPNLLGANTQYIEEYYNFSESYFFYFPIITNQLIALNPNRSLGLAWILLFRRVDFVWILMKNSELLRIKNRQKTLPDKTIQTIQNNCQAANYLYVKPI